MKVIWASYPRVHYSHNHGRLLLRWSDHTSLSSQVQHNTSPRIHCAQDGALRKWLGVGGKLKNIYVFCVSRILAWFLTTTKSAGIQEALQVLCFSPIESAKMGLSEMTHGCPQHINGYLYSDMLKSSERGWTFPTCSTHLWQKGLCRLLCSYVQQILIDVQSQPAWGKR